jgi:hypothetical protein
VEPKSRATRLGVAAQVAFWRRRWMLLADKEFLAGTRWSKSSAEAEWESFGWRVIKNWNAMSR